ncbi:MAG: exopolysaccharide biosynthesis protein [Sedimentitalea sp.]
MKDDHALNTTFGQNGDQPAPKSRGLFRAAGKSTPSMGLTPVRQRTVRAPLAPVIVQPPAGPLPDWNDLRLVLPGVRKHILHRSPLVNFFREDPVSKSFDLLRTRLLQTLRANGWHRIAIAAPTQGCGSTFTAVNLAQSLSRVQGSRNVLMDLNHRKPGLAKALDMDDVSSMRGFLSGDVSMERHLVRASKTLAVGLTGGADQDAAELLHDARCAASMDRISTALRPDVVLCDLPPILEFDDLAAFLPQVDGVLLVANGTKTLPKHIAACEKVLEGNTRVLGVILNQGRCAGPDPLDA